MGPYTNQTKGLGQLGGSSYPQQMQDVSNAPSEITSSRIRDGVCHIEEQVAELHSAISALEQRLDTVITPVPLQVAAANTKDGGSGPPNSHLYDRVSKLNNDLQEARIRLRNLISRVEV